MGLIQDLFGSSDSQGPPPKPDDVGPRSKEVEVDAYETTLHFKNGDVETTKTYGQYRNDADKVVYNDEFKASGSIVGKGVSHGFPNRVISYKVLTRDPIDEEIGTETWRITWEQDYEKEYWNSGRFKEWSPVTRNVKYELVEEAEDDPDE